MPYLFNFSFQRCSASKPVSVWDYAKGKFSDLNNALYATPWEFIVMNSPNVDCPLNVTDVINQSPKTFIPTKIIYASKRNKPWFNHELKTLIRKRIRYYKRWRKTNNMNYKRLYNKLRNLIQRKIKLAKKVIT